MPGNQEFFHHDIALINELKTQAPVHMPVLNDDQPFTPEDDIRPHSAGRDWLTEMLVEPFVGKTVVVPPPTRLPRHGRYIPATLATC